MLFNAPYVEKCSWKGLIEKNLKFSIWNYLQDKFDVSTFFKAQQYLITALNWF